MVNILYIVSTFKRSGPTNQLYNILSNLDSAKFEVTVITLSKEETETRIDDFKRLDLKIIELGLSRIMGLFVATGKIRKIINELKPNVIHTQGIRPDSIASVINPSCPWIMTIRNFPYDDYPMKFGRVRGGVMAAKHIQVMKRCKNVIACSKTIANQLISCDVKALPIQNGVKYESSEPRVDYEYESPVFITVGSLIARKNVGLTVDAFRSLGAGSLIVVGDGEEMHKLKEMAKGTNTYFVGEVSNVGCYLGAADYFVSSSLSEGLPNTVLEALAAGLPTLLSNIPSHIEIKNEASRACKIFKLSNGSRGLSKYFVDIGNVFSEGAHDNAISAAKNIFSAKIMAQNYQNLYCMLRDNK